MKHLGMVGVAMALFIAFSSCSSTQDYGLFTSPFTPRPAAPRSSREAPPVPPKVSFRIESTWRALEPPQRTKVQRNVASTVTDEKRSAARPSALERARPGFGADPDYLERANAERLRELASARRKVAVPVRDASGKAVVVLATIDGDALAASGRSVTPADVSVVSDALALNTSKSALQRAVAQTKEGGEAVVRRGGSEFNILPESVSIGGR